MVSKDAEMGECVRYVQELLAASTGAWCKVYFEMMYLGADREAAIAAADKAADEAMESKARELILVNDEIPEAPITYCSGWERNHGTDRPNHSSSHHRGGTAHDPVRCCACSGAGWVVDVATLDRPGAARSIRCRACGGTGRTSERE